MKILLSAVLVFNILGSVLLFSPAHSAQEDASLKILETWTSPKKEGEAPREVPIPQECKMIASAYGEGKTKEIALKNFKLNALAQGGNAATLLSGSLQKDKDGKIFSYHHAGLVYRCKK